MASQLVSIQKKSAVPLQAVLGVPLQGNPRLRLQIDLRAVVANFRSIARCVKPAQVLAVLKADGYGLGAIPLAKALERAGAQRFGVAEIGEAVQLKNTVGKPVQILGALLQEEVPLAVKHGIICPVGDTETAQQLSREALRQKRKVKVHLKLDTGMGRLGFPAGITTHELFKVLSLPGLEWEGIYSHFSNANQPRHPHSRQQIAEFKQRLSELKDAGFSFPLIHMANSDGINNFPGAYFNLVRTGINLYGVFDLLGHRAYRLRPSLTWTSRLIARRKLEKGASIGYGCTHILKKATWVGTIPAGYADGIPLAASSKGHVLIRGVRCPILGRVSMDYLTIDLSPVPKAQKGDSVVLVGRSGQQEITVEDWARLKGTHPYDIICSLGARVQREWKE
jgi:alanine racemase